VLVVGAGPAGCAAAICLAREGTRVVLVDQNVFPRDKVCGDGLISDALSALATLGLREAVLKEASAASELHVYPPYGRYVALRGGFACLPRERLDAMMADAARAAGATCVFGTTATGVLEDEHRLVTGARFAVERARVDVRARVTLLATGANAAALRQFGLPASMQPDAVAGRAYYEVPPDEAARLDSLIIGYDRAWCPGYGWIFPSPGNRVNIGVGLFTSNDTERRLREFWTAFTTRFAPAAGLLRSARLVKAFRGAPLRTSMTGASFGRPGLLAVGEAASLTYAATGEGIGKAMESGILAARYAQQALAGRRRLPTLHEEYEREFREQFSLRYRAYSVAQRWAANPIVLSLLASRTNAGSFARRELEELVAERSDARVLFSKRGLLKAVVS
jgi:geranylgeranyl reductase family protein